MLIIQQFILYQIVRLYLEALKAFRGVKAMAAFSLLLILELQPPGLSSSMELQAPAHPGPIGSLPALLSLEKEACDLNKKIKEERRD